MSALLPMPVLVTALVLVGVGVALLVVLLLVVRRPVRRFSRTRADFRRATARRVRVLEALVNSRAAARE